MQAGLLHFDGATWQKYTIPTDLQLRGFWGTSKDDVWVIGPRKVVYHYLK